MHAHQLQDTALRYFLEVVRGGSLTEASARLHVAASAISRQIAGLEQSLGTVLFERQPRGMVPTAAGEILAAHARRSSLDAEHALEEIQALQGLRSGKVRMAITEGFASAFLPPLIIEFRQRYARIQFQVDVTAPAEVPVRVRDGDADIGLTFSRAPERDIKVEHRQSAPILALMHPDHPLAGSKALTLRSLSAYPLALPMADTTLRQMIDIACSRQQLLLEPVLSTNYLATLLSFVLQGGGISVAGEVSVRQLVAAGQLVAVPIRDHGMELRDIELQTLAGRTLPHAAQSFLDHIKLHLPAETST
ncbi:transcriptional regulator, LysR family [Rhodoferax sp. OV413]|uniref:LysR family transcriptional regulator n=1 Tax=Rhodoferax sp. OV413 TaxID=1855285 RepID=UPI00088F06F5|nr:LysR family transcriptional regulator [Rhodoferax sp. OV413]SDO30626.1 transcriptional regulator, LysR family [Rhodoferax sp. OV413]